MTAYPLIGIATLLAGALFLEAQEPPRDAALVEKKWEELSNHDLSAEGSKALAVEPKKWKHAETDNFVLHFRRLTEARKAAREVEYDIAFIAQTLGAGKERYSRKSHVFVFEDDKEWENFVMQTDAPPWSVSFAHGDELFLNIRRSETTGRFNSETLAHETTHAVVARLYPRRRWPLWLNEGFAEYMGGASVAARKNQTLKRHEQKLTAADMRLDELFALEQYPKNQADVGRLYQSAERFVRFMMTELPRERFPQFIDAVLDGAKVEDAIVKIYGDKFKNFDEFKKKYN
ncbi:MAG: hypothetical protein M3O82_05790 [Verrucomicrobiota bacterium]|nr:hypothetical protein [Verrucomicrobiota bacterium]